MSAQPDRVVEILLDLTEPDGRTRKGYGTGYRITTGLVLTSAHLFGRAGRAAGCAVRGFGGARTASAALVLDLRDEADLAVLRLADTHGWPRVAPVRFGVLPPEGGVRFALIGWPRAAESASVRDSVELTGTIAAGANIKSGRLKLYIQGPTPRFTGTHASPWSGISGAAVFAHTALVGVVREHLVSLGVDQLDAEPLEALTDSPAFRDLLTAENATRPLVRLLPDRPPEERGPPLEAKLTRPTPAVVLNFRARATALVGREPELRRLRDFLSSDSPFRWQLLSGAGGMGKSRLALELCLEAAADGWHAGFLIPDVPFAWSSWLPARPTLIVVDEIEYRKDTVREIVRVLSARSDELTDRVRVLLLAREKAARIESLLKIEPTDWDVFFADTAAGPAIELGELDAGDAARLARDVPGGTAAPASAGSPLHTMLAALAGPGQRAWDAALIGRYVLRRNRMSYWQDMTDLDEAALAYACITRDTSDALPHSGLLPELEPAGWRELVARNHAFTGTDAPGLAPLEPGPIGELFTLDLIARAPDAESTEDLGHRVVAAAFRLNPLANEFALRCMLHYPEHQGLPRLIAAMVEEFDLSSPSPFFTGLPILIESAGQYAESGDVALAFAEAEAARLLTVRESLSLLTAGSYSELLFNLVTKFCQAGDWPAADRALALTRESAELTGFAAIAGLENQGKAYTNYLVFAQQQNEVVRGRAAIRELVELSRGHHGDAGGHVHEALISAMPLEPDCRSALNLLTSALDPAYPQQIARAAFNVANRAVRESAPGCALAACDLSLDVWHRNRDPAAFRWLTYIAVPLGLTAAHGHDAEILACLSELDTLARPMSGADRRHVFLGLSNFLTQTTVLEAALTALALLCDGVGTFPSDWPAEDVPLIRSSRVVHTLSADPADVRRILRDHLGPLPSAPRVQRLSAQYDCDLTFLAPG